MMLRLAFGRPWRQAGWRRAVNYRRRSLAEVAMFRYKNVIGRGLHVQTLPAQKTEAEVACKVLNIMTGLPPDRLTPAGKGEIRPPPDFCTKVDEIA
jgi:hypothetical protein